MSMPFLLKYSVASVHTQKDDAYQRAKKKFTKNMKLHRSYKKIRKE